MRQATLAGGMALVLAAAGCTAPDATFDGIPWGAGAQELPALLSERGYRPLLQLDGPGDQMWAGDFGGHRSLLVARLGDGGLSKVLVAVLAPRERRPAVFRELEAGLTARYGAPILSEGRTGGGDAAGLPDAPRRRQVWEVGAGAGATYVILEQRPVEGVVVSYESPGWAAELGRRGEAAGGGAPGAAGAMTPAPVPSP